MIRFFFSNGRVVWWGQEQNRREKLFSVSQVNPNNPSICTSTGKTVFVLYRAFGCLERSDDTIKAQSLDMNDTESMNNGAYPPPYILRIAGPAYSVIVNVSKEQADELVSQYLLPNHGPPSMIPRGSRARRGGKRFNPSMNREFSNTVDDFPPLGSVSGTSWEGGEKPIVKLPEDSNDIPVENRMNEFVRVLSPKTMHETE